MKSWRLWLNRERDFEREMEEELRDHVERQAAENVARGMSPAEARRRAVLQFGGVEGVKETCREARGGSWIEALWQDVRYGARMLRKSPGFTAVAVLTLALGIGANTAIFSVVYGVLLRPLAYPHPEQIVQLVRTYKGELDQEGMTAREFEFWKEHRQSFQAIAAATGDRFTLSGGSQPERVRGLHVSAEYLQVLGVRPGLGRGFSPVEDVAGGPKVVVLSYGLWRSRFGADPAVIGKLVSLNEEKYTVLGVMPRGFQSVPAADLWTTIAPVNATIGVGQNYRIFGRLAAGTSRARASGYLATLKAPFLQGIEGIPAQYVKDLSLEAEPYRQLLTSGIETPLYILFGAIGLVLLIACANVANLLLARAGGRTREMAVRTAFGASRGRIARQLLTENLLLALLGGACGLLGAVAFLHFLVTLAPPDLPRATDIYLDSRALGFTALLSLITGLLFGLAPAAQGSKADVNLALKEGAGQASASAWRKRLGSGLAAAEIAVSLVLLAGSALLIETFTNLLRVNPGFDPKPVVSMQIWTAGTRYNSSDAVSGLYREMIRRIDLVPGVRSAAVIAAGLPLENGGNIPAVIAGQPQSAMFSADYREVTPAFFEAMGVPLLRGRVFADSDSAAAAKVAIVNEAFAHRYLPARNPLQGGIVSPLLGAGAMQVVGVVGDVRSQLNQPGPPTIFIPLAQAPAQIDQLFQGWYPASVIVRAAGNPDSVIHGAEAAARDAAPDLPIGQVRTMEQVLGTSVAFQQFLMMLMSIFGGLALALAAVGIYGVMSYGVAQRTREIGIRMALGARRGDVLRLVMTNGAVLALVGIAAGLGGAYGLTRFLQGALFGVQPRDPWTFAGVAILLMLVALAACWIPARRATRVDPMIALRHE